MISAWGYAVKHLQLFNINVHFHSATDKLFSLWNCILATWVMKSIIIMMLKLLFVIEAWSLIITVGIWCHVLNIARILTLAISSLTMISIFRMAVMRLRFFDWLTLSFFSFFLLFFTLFFWRLSFWFYFNHIYRINKF